MSKLFEKMYIGNPKKKDLTKKDIERQSRLSLFFTVVRTRNWNLILVNLLYALFLLPTFALLYLEFNAVGLVLQQDSYTLNDLVEVAFQTIYFLFPCMLIATPGTLGFTNVLHRWANDEHAWLSDFWTGIKKNWKQGLIVTVINYIVLLVLIFGLWFYFIELTQLDKTTGSSFGIFGEAIGYIVLGITFIYFMVHMYVYPLLVRYKLTIKQIYKYAFILAFSDFVGSVALVLYTLLVVFLVFTYIPTVFMFLFAIVVGLVLVYLVIYVRIGKTFNKRVFIAVKDY